MSRYIMAGLACLDTTDDQRPALAAFHEPLTAKISAELLRMMHSIRCGDVCRKDRHLLLLLAPCPAKPASRVHPAARSRYNKDTAPLFALIGGEGYRPDTSQRHGSNTWPLLEAVLR